MSEYPTLTRLERRHNMLADAIYEMDGETPLWAYAASNGRALACVQDRHQREATSLKGAAALELSDALDKLEEDGYIIETPVDRLQTELDEGFIQGLARAWDVLSMEPLPDHHIEQAAALDS